MDQPTLTPAEESDAEWQAFVLQAQRIIQNMPPGGAAFFAAALANPGTHMISTNVCGFGLGFAEAIAVLRHLAQSALEAAPPSYEDRTRQLIAFLDANFTTRTTVTVAPAGRPN